MELKFALMIKWYMNHGCSNRTFMELKCIEVALLSDAIVGSNRTFMELKCKLAKMTVENLGF